MRHFEPGLTRLLTVAALLGLVLLLGQAAVSEASGKPQASQCSGYYYTVRAGDTWSIISRRVGVTVAELKQTNPQAVRQSNWVLIGEQLCVPSQGSSEEAGYWYDVQPGDTWNTVARMTGVPVRELWDANPGLINRWLWLYIGQRVWIPDQVETETSEAAPRLLATPTTEEDDEAAAPATEEEGGAAATPLIQALPEATADVTVTATITPAPAATATPLPASPTPVVAAVEREATPTVIPPTQTPTAPTTTPTLPVETESPTAVPPTSTPTAVLRAMTPTLTPTAAATSSVAPTAQALPDDCPTSLEAYADAVLDQLNDEATTPEDLQTWLVACRSVTADEQGVTVAPLAQGQDATIVVLHDPAAAVFAPQGLVLVYHKTAQDYTLAHKYEGMGRVELVLASDINGDDNFDLVYSDSSCGAHTCFGTLRVESWDGEAYQDWIEGEPTIAGPEYQFENVTAEGEGDEILVHGGVIDSAGAGPQRAWTEIYMSPEGGAYVLLSREYDPSPCLYHRILDANAAFDKWAHEGFDQAIESYEAAIADEEAEACGAIDDEVEKLQDFARFRLLVAHVSAGSAAQGIELAGEITQPDVRAVAQAFLTSYRVSGSVIQACRDTTSFGEAEPSSWEFLADWGYANPSFTAFDLCPVN